MAGTETFVPVSRMSCRRLASTAVAVAAIAIVVGMRLFGWAVSGFVAVAVGRWAMINSEIRVVRVGLVRRVERAESWLWLIA